MGRWVGQKMAQKIGYPLWMAPNKDVQECNPDSYTENSYDVETKP